MSQKISHIVIIPLILLSSCVKSDKNTDDFIFAGIHESVINNVIVGQNRNSGSMQYTDLETNTTMSVCSQPGCKHTSGSPNCTARGEGDYAVIRTQFVYGDNLYFVNQSDNSVQIYKCDLGGGNRKKMFSYSFENTDESKYTTPVPFRFEYADSKLYMLIDANTWKPSANELGMEMFVQSNYCNSSLICFDLKTDKGKVLYETGIKVCADITFNLLPDNSAALIVRYNSDDKYGLMEYEELVEAMKTDDYKKTTVIEKVCINSGGEIFVYDFPGGLYGFRSDGEYIYYIDYIDGIYMNGGSLFKQNYASGEKEVLREKTYDIFIYDNTLFTRNYENKEYEVYYYKENEWVKSPFSWFLQGKTKSYFLVNKDGETAAIKKSDYYNGIDTSLKISESEEN